MATRNICLVSDIDSTNIANGDLCFWWLGQHSFIVKTQNNTLYFDIFLSDHGKRLMPPPAKASDLTNADYIFGTHNHRDHIDIENLPELLTASKNCRFICPCAVKNSIGVKIKTNDRFVFLDHNCTFQDEHIKVTALKAKHEFFDNSSDGTYPYLQYIVECDNVTIYHSGDTLVYDGMLSLLADYTVDIAFLPINGRDAERYKRGCMGNITYQEAVDLAGELKPKLVVPAHYGMFADNTENPELFKNYLYVKYPEQNVRIAEYCLKNTLSELI
ncbi:MAG: MBL fold metallo-hydrolase [Planctomycetota bacterium]|jgi:L-ascorbate metabolism protein UlaG (beta-lactamase superfamily)